MLKILKNSHELEINAYIPVGVRVLFIVFALLPLMAPYDLILRTDWQHYLNVFFFTAVFISTGALIISCFFVWAAIAGVDMVLKFDFQKNEVQFSSGTPLLRWNTQTYPIADILSVGINENDWNDGAPSYTVVVEMRHRQPIRLNSTFSRREADNVAHEITSVLVKIHKARL